MFSLPDGDVYFVVRTSAQLTMSELFHFVGKGQERCVPLFTSPFAGERFRRSLPDVDWELMAQTREKALTLLGRFHGVGVTRVVLNPEPGYTGQGSPIFGVLYESVAASRK